MIICHYHYYSILVTFILPEIVLSCGRLNLFGTDPKMRRRLIKVEETIPLVRHASSNALNPQTYHLLPRSQTTPFPYQFYDHQDVPLLEYDVTAVSPNRITSDHGSPDLNGIVRPPASQPPAPGAQIPGPPTPTAKTPSYAELSSNDNLVYNSFDYDESNLKKSLGGSIMIGPYTPTQPLALINDSAQLNCRATVKRQTTKSLEETTLDCRWYNEEKSRGYDQLDWLLAYGTPDPLKLIHQSDTAMFPSSPTLLAVSQARQGLEYIPVEAILVSAPIGCLQGTARLQFKHWISRDLHLRPHSSKQGEPTLSVCWRYLNERTLRDCIIVKTKNPGPTQAVIEGPIRGPLQCQCAAAGTFQLVFLGQKLGYRYKSPAFLMIDDIIFEADVATTCNADQFRFDKKLTILREQPLELATYDQPVKPVRTGVGELFPITFPPATSTSPLDLNQLEYIRPAPVYTTSGAPPPSVVPSDPFLKHIDLANQLTERGWSFQQRFSPGEAELYGDLRSRFSDPLTRHQTPNPSANGNDVSVQLATSLSNFHVNDVNMCNKLICDFKNTFCSWNPRGPGASGLGRRIGWTLHSLDTPSRHTIHLIRQSNTFDSVVDSYVEAKYPDPRRTGLDAEMFYVLESPVVEFFNSVYLQTSIMLPTPGTQLAICLETVNVDAFNNVPNVFASVERGVPEETCVWVSPIVQQQSSNQWHRQIIKLPRGRYKVRIMASYDDQLRFEGGQIGLGEIQIVHDPLGRTPLCEKSNVAERHLG